MKYTLNFFLLLTAVVSFNAMQGSAVSRLVSRLSAAASVKTKFPQVQRQLLVDKKEGVKVYGAAYPLANATTFHSAVPLVEIQGAFPLQPYTRGGKLNVFRHRLPLVIIASLQKGQKLENISEPESQIVDNIHSLWSDNFKKDYIYMPSNLFLDIKPNFNADLTVYLPDYADVTVEMQNFSIVYTHDPKFPAYVYTDSNQLVNHLSSAGAVANPNKKYTVGWRYPWGNYPDLNSPDISLKTSNVIEIRAAEGKADKTE